MRPLETRAHLAWCARQWENNIHQSPYQRLRQATRTNSESVREVLRQLPGQEIRHPSSLHARTHHGFLPLDLRRSGLTRHGEDAFLNEVDGLDSNDGILVIGSMNYLETLDPAISKRPSRFDRKYHFKIPDLEEREAYCRFWAGKLEGNGLVQWEEGMESVVARLCEGFSFAYLKELFVIALLTIARGAHLEDESSSSGDTDKVIVEHEGAEKEEEKEEEEEVKKRTLPEVEVPEHLKDNVLLKVIKAQLKVLLEEMDNTKEEDWPSSKVSLGGNSKMRDYARQMMILQAQNAGDD